MNLFAKYITNFQFDFIDQKEFNRLNERKLQ